MSANLATTNGRAAFMSLRESAWHEMGTVVEQPVGSKVAIALAGLNWPVEEYNIIREDATPIGSHKVIVRGDTKETLGVVGKSYTPIQNQALFDWLDGLDGFADVTIETAGALGKGETVWVLARCGGMRFSIRGDEFQGYISLTNGHGGNHQLMVTPTSIRQCCQNTTRMVMQQDRRNTLASGFNLRHTSNIQESFDRIRECYARTTESWKKTQEVMNLLASKPLTDEALTRLITDPFAKPKATGSASALEADLDALEREQGVDKPLTVMGELNANARRAAIETILASPTCQVPGTRDTIFAGYNAVSEYLEHAISFRTDKNLSEADKARSMAAKRFASANFGGQNDERKSKAFAVAMELAGA